MTALRQTYTHADWQYAYGTPCTGPDVADERRIDIAPHAGGGVAVRHTMCCLQFRDLGGPESAYHEFSVLS